RITTRILLDLQRSRKAPGCERIYVAGEKEYEIEQERRRTGIPVNENLKRELQTMRDALGIASYEAYF
ncbi:MAG: Ldh family oxidoreductase, partial [Anaerolineae bacterium]